MNNNYNEYLQEQINKQKQWSEEQRQETFKRIQKVYKQQGAFKRLKLALDGKKPNWNKISRYSREKLDFLMKTLDGKTRVQESQENVHEALFGIGNPERVRKDNHQDRWDYFNERLASEAKLNSAMETEEFYQKSSMGGRRR